MSTAAGFGTTCPREFVIEAGMTDPAAAVTPETTLPSASVTAGMIGAITVLEAAAVFGITFPFESVTMGMTGAATVRDGFEMRSPLEFVIEAGTSLRAVLTPAPALLTIVFTPSPALLTAALTAPPALLTTVLTPSPALLTTVSTPAAALLTAELTGPPALLITVLTPSPALLTMVLTPPPTLLAMVLTPPAALLTAVLRSPPTLLASGETRGTITPLGIMVELGATFEPKAFVKAVYRSVPVGAGVSGFDEISPKTAPAFVVAGMPVSVAELPSGAPVSVAVAAGALGCDTPGKGGTLGALNVAPTVGTASGGAV